MVKLAAGKLAANPTADTVLAVESILEAESRGDAQPLSLAEIERRMKAKRTRLATVKASVQLLVHYGVAAIGSKGVIYTRTPQHVAREAVRGRAAPDPAEEARTTREDRWRGMTPVERMEEALRASRLVREIS